MLLSEDKRPIPDGMVPEKKLYAINRVCKEDKRPIEDEIGPVRELNGTSRDCKDDKRPIEDGRGPVSECKNIFHNTYLHRESTSTHKNRAL